MKREWIDVTRFEAWNVPYKIAKHHIYMYWTHPKLFPCDEMGFRIPTGFSSFKEKYRKSKDMQLRNIFCLGSSTTFGLFCSYDDCYVHHLENYLPNSAVFNFGLCGLDHTGATYILLDLLRLDYIPDIVIFLDGINEKQGWIQASEGNKNYEEMSWQYRCFRELIFNNNIPMSLKWEKKENIMKRLRKKIVENVHDPNKLKNQSPLRFIEQQSESYVKSCRAIQKIAAAWNINANFLLEPTVWDVWDGHHDLLYNYLKALYKNIIGKCENVIDISKKTSLGPAHFIEWKHINKEGHRILAEDIAREIFMKA